MRAVLGIVLLATVVTIAVWERGSVGRLRAANESLRAEKLEADRLANENRELPKLRSASAATFPGGGGAPSTELLRLRDEMRRLRAQPQEAARLRAENERLAAEIKSGKVGPKRLADMEGFIPRERWLSAGFATPEAAAQSFFGAMLSGDVDRFLRSAMPEDAERLRQLFNEDPERFRNELQETGSQLLGKASGFRIAEQTDASDTRITLNIQFAADGETLPLLLRRVGNEWKVDAAAEPARK
jgi:hypothetical protein